MDETLGKWNFWTFLIFFNVTFMPMHFTGLLGMPRRVYTYGPDLGVTELNQLSTVGAIGLGFSVLIFLVNLFTSLRSGEIAGDDPWDGATLEWSISSPPPVYNFARIPIIDSRDAWWAMKHAGMRPTRSHDSAPPAIHMPSPSYFPLMVATGLAVMASGLLVADAGDPITIPIFAVVGLLIVLAGIYGWSFEPASSEHEA